VGERSELIIFRELLWVRKTIYNKGFGLGWDLRVSSPGMLLNCNMFNNISILNTTAVNQTSYSRKTLLSEMTTSILVVVFVVTCCDCTAQCAGFSSRLFHSKSRILQCVGMAIAFDLRLHSFPFVWFN
jgi:hypothetical protein